MISIKHVKDVVTATTLLTSSLTCVKGKVKVTGTIIIMIIIIIIPLFLPSAVFVALMLVGPSKSHNGSWAEKMPETNNSN